MTTQKPVFGKKTSAQVSPRPAASQALSAKAEAFLQREREAAGEKSYEAGGHPFSSSMDGVSGGKPVCGRRVIARIFDELLVWGLLFLIFHEDIGRQLSVYIEAPMGSAQEDAAGFGLLGYALIWAVLECGYNIEKSSKGGSFYWYDENPTDGYFGFDLWLKTYCAGHSLWAFNLRQKYTMQAKKS